MTFNAELLYFFVRDPLIQYSEDFRILNLQSPMQFSLNQQKYSVHISYVHDSGNARGNPDEVRIQVARRVIDVQKERMNQGYKIAFLGFFEGGSSFVAWETEYAFSLETNTLVSLYGRETQYKDAEINHAGLYQFNTRKLNRDSRAVSMQSSSLGIYLENMKAFHLIEDIALIRGIIADAKSGKFDRKPDNSFEMSVEQNSDRVKFIYQNKAYPRDPKFVKDVLEAYKHACCICNKQLKIVQAAHIIPHSEDDCPSTVNNGLALCAEHHKYYDDGLLIPIPNRKLYLNEKRIEFLKSINQSQGLDELYERQKTEYLIPDQRELQPSEEYLKKGLRIRIGQAA